jgi:hypothetical protein
MKIKSSINTEACIMPVILADISKCWNVLKTSEAYVFCPSPVHSPVNDGAPDYWSQCLTLLVMTVQVSVSCLAYWTTTDRERIANDCIPTLRRWPDIDVNSTRARDRRSSKKSCEESGDQNGLNIFRASSTKRHHHGDEERYKYRPFSSIDFGKRCPE